jgi:hypothetical protein
MTTNPIHPSRTTPPEHDPSCGILGPCLDCKQLVEAAERKAFKRENRRKQRLEWLDSPATRRDVKRIIRAVLRRELAPIIAYLRRNQS